MFSKRGVGGGDSGVVADVDEVEDGVYARDVLDESVEPGEYVPQMSRRRDDPLESENLLASAAYNTSGDDPFRPDRAPLSADFPARLERAWAPFDDAGIALFQSRPLRGPGPYYFSLLVSSALTFDTLAAVSVVLAAVGWDADAMELAFATLVCALLCQTVRRFVYRERPYLVRRALQCRADVTGSFVSQTTAIAVVVAAALARAATRGGGGGGGGGDSGAFGPLGDVGGPVLCVFSATLVATFARVNLGSNYPSDCVAGAGAGAVAAAAVYAAAAVVSPFGCASCDAPGRCYTPVGSPRAIEADSLERANVPLWLGFSVGCLAAVGGSLLPPLSFWRRGHHVFGCVLAVIALKITLLCPEHSPARGSLPPPEPASAGSVIFGVAVAGFSTAFGASGTRAGAPQRIARFGIIYLGTFALLVLWRTAIDSPG